MSKNHGALPGNVDNPNWRKLVKKRRDKAKISRKYRKRNRGKQ